jgi:hypothetical protein
MTETSPENEQLLTLLVIEDSHDDRSEPGHEAHGMLDFFRKVAHPTDIEIHKIEPALNKILKQTDYLLSKISKKTEILELNELEVSLGINAEGSIGVVTTGVTTSITLIYRVTKS